MATPPLGTRLARDLCLDEDAIREGARLTGDFNPLHHDADVAAASRYGGLIASGGHTAALLAGLISVLLSERGFGPAVGTDYRVRFLRPVRAGQAMRMEWAVAAIEPARNGEMVRLEGAIVDAASGVPALRAEMRCLFFGTQDIA